MTEQLPIENHGGAMLLIKDCWSLRDGPEQWRRSMHQLHGAAMACDDALASDLSFLASIAYYRIVMAKAVQS